MDKRITDQSGALKANTKQNAIFYFARISCGVSLIRGVNYVEVFCKQTLVLIMYECSVLQLLFTPKVDELDYTK